MNTIRRRPSTTVLSVLLAGAAIAAISAYFATAEAQMDGGMRAMMQRMMADRLPPGIDPKLLPDPQSAGAGALERYCSQCHNLPGPGMHTVAEWPEIVARMTERMRMMNGMMGGVVAPTQAETDTLLRYLQAHAQRPIDAKRYSDLDSPAGRSFQATCAQCHALPDPAQHSAAQWPGVVARMQHNMAVMGRPAPDPETLARIMAFLEHHALGSDESRPKN